MQWKEQPAANSDGWGPAEAPRLASSEALGKWCQLCPSSSLSVSWETKPPVPQTTMIHVPRALDILPAGSSQHGGGHEPMNR